MTIVLGCLLIPLSVASLFVGVIDVNIPGLFLATWSSGRSSSSPGFPGYWQSFAQGWG